MTEVRTLPPSVIYPAEAPAPVPDDLGHRRWPVHMNYDHEARESYIHLRAGEPVRQVQLDATVIADIRADGYVCGIRLLGAQDGALIAYLPPEDPA